MIKAVVLDLDGTIIGPDEQVTPAVQSAVARLARRVPVSIATGRESSDVLRYSEILGLTAPQVCDGGATILAPKSAEVLWRDPLGPENSRTVIDRLRSLNTEFIATFPQGSVRDFDQLHDWDITRISALDISESLAEELAGRFSHHPGIQTVKAYLPYNGLWAVDFTQRGVDKGAAAARLGDMLGCTTQDMAGVGDSYNDLALLRACGLAIAMGNAPPEVKAAADYVAPGVAADGLAVAIEEFLLPQT